jgi:NodT family efflux transporter outer membrane factor (OMF) lipoprotein
MPVRAVRWPLAWALAGGLASACSLAPPYAPPTPPPVSQYKEQGPWTSATPADALPRGGWWAVFKDPVLDGLEQRIDSDNPTLAGALARDQAAQAYVQFARAPEAPNLGVGASTNRNRQSDNRPLRGANQPDFYTANTLGLQIDYELDLWGRVRNAVAAAQADAQASTEDLAAIKLSLEAQLADDYVQLRGLDAQADLLSQTVDAYGHTVTLTEHRRADGIASKFDLDRATAQLQTAKAQVADVSGRRAAYEHAIASLVGQPASTFSLPANKVVAAAPNVPPAIPSVLLQRRPDVAAAERRMAAANARIGVAKAAFYPSIMIDGSVGFQNTGGPDLLSYPNSYWGIGPALVLNLFDNGARKAQAAVAKAQFDAASADYRARVLQAFQDVEDSLAQENDLASEAKEEAGAIDAAREAQTIAERRYDRGLINYLDLVTSQQAALQAAQAGLDVATRRAQASIHLIRAIGGGWAGEPAS